MPEMKNYVYKEALPYRTADQDGIFQGNRIMNNKKV